MNSISTLQVKVEQQLKTLAQFSYCEKAVGIMQIFWESDPILYL